MAKRSKENIPINIESLISTFITANKIVDDSKLKMSELYQKLPPSENLKSVDGMFIVPFVLREWDLSEDFDTANKIKAVIAHDPNSVLAIAYRMGIYDENAGKSESQRINKHKSVDETLQNDLGINCKELRKQYKQKRLPSGEK